MKELILVILCWTAAEVPARPASLQFKVELFSKRNVRALTLETAGTNLNLCGTTEGHCWELSPATRISCFADRLIHCRSGATSRDFSLLTVDSAQPFSLTPTFDDSLESPQKVSVRNLRMGLTRAGIQVLTQVDLESYVSGVLRGEASILRAPAAREAMAIVARTWAIRWQGRHHGEGFDFCSLTHCLVFQLPREREGSALDNMDQAARATHGQVLQYHGKLADPYFTACCGGMTESAGNIWPDRGQPYLISIRDPYCLANSHASWRRVIATQRLQNVLRDDFQGERTFSLSGIAVEKRDSSGRAQILQVTGGRTSHIDANRFRYAVDRRLGWGQLESNLYTVERQGDDWVFSGHGLGHGVGLCQAGAEQMARMGSSAEKILSTYFPGTDIALRPPDDSDPVASSEHFELAYPSSQEPWVSQTLKSLEDGRRELGAHAQILPFRVKVRTWSSVGEFIRATGQPGWMAATSDGQAIFLQPLELLARKQIMLQTLRHELTHLVVHRLRAEGVPRWFEEGLVLNLTGERIDVPAAAPNPFRSLEEAVIKPRSETEMKTAYSRAWQRVRQRASRQGDADLWRTLQHPRADDFDWFRERW